MVGARITVGATTALLFAKLSFSNMLLLSLLLLLLLGDRSVGIAQGTNSTPKAPAWASGTVGVSFLKLLEDPADAAAASEPASEPASELASESVASAGGGNSTEVNGNAVKAADETKHRAEEELMKAQSSAKDEAKQQERELDGTKKHADDIEVEANQREADANATQVVDELNEVEKTAWETTGVVTAGEKKGKRKAAVVEKAQLERQAIENTRNEAAELVATAKKEAGENAAAAAQHMQETRRRVEEAAAKVQQKLRKRAEAIAKAVQDRARQTAQTLRGRWRRR